MAPQTSTKLTYEDYLLLPDDGRRHELIDGEHYVSPSPNTVHQRIAKRILRLLLSIEDSGVGEVFFAPFDVVLSNFDVVQPDLFFVSASRARIVTGRNVQGPPDIAIEILSESNRQYDRLVKYKLYEQLGVNEYWIIDPDAGAVEVYHRSTGRFVRVDIGDTLTSPLLPGFALSVRELFA